MARGVADVAGDLRGFGCEPVTLETQRDNGIVVSPDGAKLIGLGIERSVIRRKRTNPPARPHIGRHQPRHDTCCAILGNDARPQAMARI